MNAGWLLQDPALRTLPRRLSWSLATTLLLLGVAVSLGLYDQKASGGVLGTLASTALFGLVLWLPATVLLLSRSSRTRCSSFDLSLPVTTERLWMRHVIATALSGMLLLLMIGGIAALLLYMLGFYKETPLPLTPGAFIQLTTALMVGFAFAATLIQAEAPGRVSLPASRGSTARRFLLAMGIFLLIVFMMQLSLVLLVFPALATWFLARWARRRLPATWPLESEWEQPALPAAQGSWEEFPQRAAPWGKLAWQLYLLRALFSGTPKAGMALWIGVPMLLGFGALLSGAFIYMGDDEIRWTMLFITIYMLFALFAKPLAFLHSLDALPLSRRHVFALLTLPSLLVLIAGYGAGTLFVGWKGLPQADGIRALRTCAGVGVPTALHEISWDGSVEPVVAPWGESHAPFTVPVAKGWKPVVVSRFCTRDSNVSMEFQLFQASLAAEALYGEAPPDDTLRDFLASSEGAAPRFLESQNSPRLPGEIGVFPILMALLCLGAFGVLALYLRTFRVGRLDRLRKITFVSLLGVLLALHMAQFLLLALGMTNLWAWDVLWKTGTRSLVATLPGGALTLWILAGLLTWMAYRMAERQFERAELPVSTGRSRC